MITLFNTKGQGKIDLFKTFSFRNNILWTFNFFYKYLNFTCKKQLKAVKTLQ